MSDVNGTPKSYEQLKAALPPHDEEDGKKSQAQQIVDDVKVMLRKKRAELFHTADGDAFISVKVKRHWETWPIRSSAAGLFLRRRFYKTTDGRAPNAQAIADARAMLESLAMFDGKERPVFTRTAETCGKIYIDLCDERWRAVEVDAQGWRVLDARPPVRFVRRPGMLPLPVPVHQGTQAQLRQLVNVDEQEFMLLAAWLVAALRPRGPYPVLALYGEQGSGKSTVARMLRRLIDPNKAESRAEPRDEQDLIIAATNGWAIAIDNLSRMQGWLSDALCRLATGTGFGKRKLYTDGEETIFEAQRPIILNGIEEVATRGDLLSRAIVIRLPIIPEDKRRTEEELWNSFNAVAPSILGALLDGASTAIGRLPHVNLAKLPRMADFARWAVAAGPALGFDDDAFMRAYALNRSSANQTALDASPLVTVIEQLVTMGEIRMSPTELLAALNEKAGEPTRRSPEWPRSARALTGALNRLAPNLRAIGFTCTYERDKRRLWRIEGPGRKASEASETSTDGSAASKPTVSADIRRVATTEKHGSTDTSDTSDASAPLLSGLVTPAGTGTNALHGDAKSYDHVDEEVAHGLIFLD